MFIISWSYLVYNFQGYNGGYAKKDANGNDGAGNIGHNNDGDGNIGDKNLGNGNIGNGNLGSGNIGDANWGNGQIGNYNGNPNHSIVVPTIQKTDIHPSVIL